MKKGDFIRIDYIGKLESGEIFDLTKEDIAKKEKVYNKNIKYKPIPIIIGKGFVIPGLDKALMEMEVGEKKSIEIPPEEGFGQRDPKLVQIMPRKEFKDIEPRQGLIVDFQGMKGRIQSVTGNRVRVDFNNPLSGKKLFYELEITAKIEEPTDQVKAAMEFFGIIDIEVKIEDETVVITTKTPLPSQIKEKLSNIVIESVKIGEKELKRVQYVEVYEKKEKSGSPS